MRFMLGHVVLVLTAFVLCATEAGCAPVHVRPQTGWPTPTVNLGVEPAQMPGPDCYIRLWWWGENGSAVAEANFGDAAANTQFDADGSYSGGMIAYISLQNRTATVAHYILKIQNPDGLIGETTTLVPVGPTANTPPHGHVGRNLGSVGIASGVNESDPVQYDARGSWDEQDNQTGIQARFDWTGDGVYDTDWSSTDLLVYHSFTRAEALTGEPVENTDPSFKTYKLVAHIQFRDSAGLQCDEWIQDEQVSVYN